MPIRVTCANGHALKAPDNAAGKRAKCPQCGVAVIVPTDAESARKTGEDAQPLRSPDDVRSQSMDDSASVKRVIEALRNGDVETRYVAAEKLASPTAESALAIAALTAALKDRYDIIEQAVTSVAHAAARSLGTWGTEATSALNDLLLASSDHRMSGDVAIWRIAPEFEEEPLPDEEQDVIGKLGNDPAPLIGRDLSEPGHPVIAITHQERWITDEVISQLKIFSELQKLEIEWTNDPLSNSILKHLKPLKNLRRIGFHATEGLIRGLLKFKNLESIYLKHDCSNDALFRKFLKLDNLEILTSHDETLSRESYDKIQQVLRERRKKRWQEQRD